MSHSVNVNQLCVTEQDDIRRVPQAVNDKFNELLVFLVLCLLICAKPN